MRGVLAGPILGEAVASASPVGGGCISAAHRVRLASGRTVFVKSNPSAPRGMFEAEAEGLRWLREAGALRVPEVLEVRAGAVVLEHVEVGEPHRDFGERLGRGLARLHRRGAESFGFPLDNFIATLPQANAPCARWSEFYAERRLRPLVHAAVDGGAFSRRAARVVEAVCARMAELVGDDEAPARLHGDLWSGNVLCDAAGEPVLIDPAVYGGHREIDLAMMRLFGGFDGRAYAAYDEAFPLAPGAGERVGLHQLYPVLVHVVLFGGGYAAQAERLAERYA